MQIRTIAAAAALVSVSGLALAQEFYTIPVGQGFADDISNTGVVSGSSGFGEQYFMWTADTGSMQIGGVTPGLGVGGQGKISADGLFISGTTFNADQGWHEMSRYDVAAGEWTGFGMIPGVGTQIDAEVSSGWAISGDGRHVVGLGWTSLGTADTHVMKWTEGVGVIDIGTMADGQSARANGVSHDGEVIVGWQDAPDGFRQGSVWIDGVQTLITDDMGTQLSEAMDVSDDGVWAFGIAFGGLFDPTDTWRFNTSTGELQTIPRLAVGADSRMAAAAVNHDGSLAGGGTWGFGSPASFGRGFVWQEGVGTTSVADFLDSKGVSYPAGYTFAFVSAISPDGNWMAGWGYPDTLRNLQTWVVRLDASCPADFDGDGDLTLFDFLAFQNAFDAGEAAADFDGDGELTLFDFLAFQNAFDAGCE
ncbi:MAG: GC-type dockerin domain-anchored protein [Phycisphaerales bacterium]